MIFCVEDDAGIRDLMIYALCSAGMQAEINRAKWKSYRLRYFTEDCQEV